MIDSSVRDVARLTYRKQNELLFRESDAVCPNCNRNLGVAYCEDGVYAVRCRYCEIVSLVHARNPRKAAEKVGIIAIPLSDWTEDEGEVIAFKFPFEDDTDICIGHPLTVPRDIPKEFTHYYRLIVPNEPKEENND